MRLQNGVDIVAVARMEKSLQREGFLRRCFSPEEQEYICRKANPAETAAALLRVDIDQPLEVFVNALADGDTTADLLRSLREDIDLMLQMAEARRAHA